MGNNWHMHMHVVVDVVSDAVLRDWGDWGKKLSSFDFIKSSQSISKPISNNNTSRIHKNRRIYR